MGKIKYIKKYFVAAFVACTTLSTFLISGANVYAATAINNPILLQALLSTGGDFIITDDITLDSSVDINNDTILDLNGHTLDFGSGTIYSWANFTVKDSSEAKTGKITSTASFTVQIGNSSNTGALILDSGTIDCRGSYCIYNYGNVEVNGGEIKGNAFVVYNNTNSTMTMDGGTVSAKTGNGVQIQQNASFVMNDGLVKTDANSVAVNVSKPGAKFTMNGGRLEALYANPSTGKGGNAISLYKDTEVTINGGVVTSTSPAIIGNGSTSGSSEGTNAKITVNGGEITSQRGPAMYIPQVNGDTTINGGVLTGETGVEIRAGKLVITGGTLNATAEEYSVISNTNGSTTTGAAVAIAQHVTEQPIDVIITGGTFNGVTPLSRENPEQTPEEAQAKITVSITGGRYDGENYEDLIENIDEGYVDVDDNGAVIVMTEEEAARREEEAEGETDGGEGAVEEEDLLPVPDTGTKTTEFTNVESLRSDASARIILATIAGITVSVGSFIIIRRHTKSE